MHDRRSLSLGCTTHNCREFNRYISQIHIFKTWSRSVYIPLATAINMGMVPQNCIKNPYAWDNWDVLDFCGHAIAEIFLSWSWTPVAHERLVQCYKMLGFYYCCLQRQLCGPLLWFWRKRKMIGITRCYDVTIMTSHGDKCLQTAFILWITI